MEQTNTSKKDAYQELAELAGSLAHEIKNPLSVIKLNMELMAEEFESENSAAARRTSKKIETIRKQCTRLENLLNDFLKFTRLSQMQLEPGELNEQIEQVLDFFEPQAMRQKIEVIRYLDADLPNIRLDKQSMHAALMNLVKNAIEAMPDGGQLVARTRITKNGVAFDLIDNGCGMDDDALLHMFNAFYSNKDQGSGLGLPIAKRIIEAHGGWISVQSDVGRGTQFTLEFPTPKRIEPETAADKGEPNTLEIG
jgi:signal transduction histidine kinase